MTLESTNTRGAKMGQALRLWILCAAFVTLWNATSNAQVSDLAGDWATDWGDMTLTAAPGGYSGSYEADNGRIELRYTVSGDFEGEWSESESGRKCTIPSSIDGSYYWGRVRFAAPTQRRQFTMHWTYCNKPTPVRDWKVRSKETVGDDQTHLAQSPIEGNWYASWADSDEPDSYISVVRQYKWDCINQQDSWCQYRVVPGAPYGIFAAKTEGNAATAPRADKVTASGSSINIEWSYGFLGHWGGFSAVSVSGENTATGGWSYGDENGKARWRKVFSSITHVQASRRRADGTLGVDRRAPGDLLTFKTTYSPPSNSMRGNRPDFVIDLYGKNMWGHHRYFMPRESGLEIVGHSFICVDGSTMSSNRRNMSCLGSGGGVAGARLYIKTWAHAEPGLKILEFDGQIIPFLLEVENYPAPFQPEEVPDPKITRVVLLDDQLGQRQEPGAKVENYSYPYKADDSRTPGENTRMLAIIGEDLTLGGAAYFSSDDPRIRYERLTLPSNIEGVVSQAAADLSGKAMQRGEQLVAVRAHLQPGIQPGVKSFKLNGEDGNWGLLFRDQFGTIALLRPGTTPNSPRESTFYINESMRIGVKALNDDFPVDGLEILLEAKLPLALQPQGQSGTRRIGRFALSKTEDVERGNNFAISPPILLTRAGDTSPPEAEAGEISVALQPNETLIARMQDRFSLLTLPPIARANVLQAPQRSSLWQSAVDKVAVCVGGDAQADAFPSETSTQFENWILTQAVANIFNDKTGTRKTTITKGDHAALILIRNELLPLIQKENVKLLAYLGTGQAGETKAQRYYSMARRTPGSGNNAFWNQRSEPNVYTVLVESTQASGQPTPETRGIKLAEMLEFEAFRTKLTNPKTNKRPNVRDTQDVINRILAKHLRKQYNETQNAIGRGYGAGNCNVKELLVIAGQKAQKAITSLLPELVKQNNGRWIPDNEARGYVRSVHLLGSEVRAMTAYAQIDDAYKSMAVAAAAAPVAFAGSAFAASGGGWAASAGTAAAALAAGADVIDMAYFGKKGVEDYLSGENDYLTMLGLGPVLGEDVVKEAQAGRSSGLGAAVGLLAPGLAGAGGLSALDDIAKVNKGRALVRGEDGLKNFEGLTDAQKIDVTAYYKSLKESEASSTVSLSAREKADLEEFNQLLAKKADSEFGQDSFDLLDIGVSNDASEGTKTLPEAPESEGLTKSLDPVAKGEGSLTKTLMEGPEKAGEKPVFSGPPRRAPKTQRELGRNEIGAPDSPFNEQLDEVFDMANSYNGKMMGQSDAKGIIEPGTRIKGDDGEDIVFGDPLGKGGFTNTYKDATEPDSGYVIKERFVPDEAYNSKAKRSAQEGPESMESLIHDSEVGRKMLTGLEEEKGVFRVAKRKGEPVWVRDGEADGGRYVYREESLAETLPNGEVVTNAAERFKARPGGQPTNAEAMTIQMAVRKLNQEGIVWTDNKLANLDVVPDASSPTGYKVVFFDFDGFRPVKGDTPLKRWSNARDYQRRFDSLGPSNKKEYFNMVLKEEPFDYRPFGKNVGAPTTLSETKNSATYSQLNQLPPDQFYRQVEQSLGINILSRSQPPPPRAPAPQPKPFTAKESTLLEAQPGIRLKERNVSREDISALMAKRARGEKLSEEEGLDLLDHLHSSGRILMEE
jgi:hypothetical protein